MSLRAFAKVKKFSDLVMYLTFYPSVGYVENLLKDCHSSVNLGFGDASWLNIVPFAGEKFSNEAWKAIHNPVTGGRVHDSHTLSDIISPELTPECDAVLCLGGIEHFPKAESRAVLEFIHGLARRVVIVALPNGLVEERSAEGHPFHLCGWDTAEFQAEGFEVHGILGLKPLRGSFAKILRKPRLFWWLVSKLSEPYVWNRPEKAFALLAVKKKRSA